MTEAEIKEILNTPFDWVVDDDKMVVVKFDADAVTAGGIIIPDTAKEPAHKGVIIALGPGITHDEQGLPKRNCLKNVGDMVIYGKYAGSELKIDIGKFKQVEIMLMRETDYLIGKPKYFQN